MIAQRALGSGAVPDVGGRNDHQQQQTERVNREVALALLDPFPAVVPTAGGGLLNRLDALGVDARGGRTHLPPRCLARVVTQCVVDGLPSPVITPQPERMVDGVLGWEVVRQGAPGDPFPDHREDRVTKLPPQNWRGGHQPWAAARTLRSVPTGHRSGHWGTVVVTCPYATSPPVFRQAYRLPTAHYDRSSSGWMDHRHLALRSQDRPTPARLRLTPAARSCALSARPRRGCGLVASAGCWSCGA